MYRVQQLNAATRKHGNASSIASVFFDSKTSEGYTAWKEEEKKLQAEHRENTKGKLAEVKKFYLISILEMRKQQIERLQLQRVVNMYPSAWKKCAAVYAAQRRKVIAKFIEKLKINLQAILGARSIQLLW